MRSPSIHSICGIPNTKGVSNFLSGDNDFSSMIHRGAAEGLSLMTAGPQPPNAAELFMGDRLAKLTRALLEQFDHVIIDAPPVMGLADAPLVGSQVEGVIFVVESHATRVSMAKTAINRLRDAQARVLGVLLTKFESRRSHYGYGYEYGYSYGAKSAQPS
jgi:capsular exopolysaccharide synthesis family protein